MDNLIDPNKMTFAEAISIMAKNNEVFQATILRDKTNAPTEIINVTFDLSTAKLSTDPYKVSFPFKSVYVGSTSDTAAQINFIPGSRDSFQGLVNLRLKDSLEFDEPRTEAYIYWPAQSGKTLTLTFFVSGKIRTGSQNILNTSSGSSSITNFTAVAMSTTQALLDTGGLSYSSMTIYNDGATTVYVGATGVTSLTGLPILPGGERVYNNSASIYGITAAGAGSLRFQTEI